MSQPTAEELHVVRDNRPRPGWLVLGLAILATGLTGPGQTIGVSVFIDHFVVDLGLSRSQVSTGYLVGTLVGAALLPFVGQFVDRRGVRVAQVAVGACFALALVNMSFVNGLVWLTIGFAGIRFLGQGSLSLVATVTVQLRFERARGTAIGIFTTASSGLMALVPVALALSINAVGWRRTWLVAAAVVGVTVVSMAWFGLRDLPTGTGRRRGDPAAAAVPGSLDRSQAVRTASFWMLASISAATSMMSTALNFHQIDLLGDAGLSETAAAALFIPQVVGSTIAGLSIGYLGDRIGTRHLPAVAMMLLLGAQVLAAIAAPGLVVIAYAVALGAAAGASRTATATLQPQWFGTGHLGSIQGAMTLIVVGASALGPVVLTLVAEGFGSYPPALVVLGAIPAAAFLFALGPNTGPDLPVGQTTTI